MLTRDPLFIVHGGGGGGRANPKVIPGSWSHLSTNWSFLFFSFILSYLTPFHQNTRFCCFFSLGAGVLIGPEATEENRLEETGLD